jgi:hypothetical protein
MQEVPKTASNNKRGEGAVDVRGTVERYLRDLERAP